MWRSEKNQTTKGYCTGCKSNALIVTQEARTTSIGLCVACCRKAYGDKDKRLFRFAS